MDAENRHIVKVTDLTAGFNGTTVLDKVSMFAPQNKITVILGSSGCGKTTLLKNIIRLYHPSSGSIRIFNQEITAMDEPEFHTLLKKVGVLFQNGALLNSISIAENVGIPLQQHTDLPRDIIERIIKVKLNLVGLGNAMDKFPSELSGGMRKRASLARAIALDPPLLFCDEPSAGLDPVTSEVLDNLLLKLRQELGMTIVLVSHEVASILRIADNVVYLDNGKVLFCGPIEQSRDAGIVQIDNFFNTALAPKK